MSLGTVFGIGVIAAGAVLAGNIILGRLSDSERSRQKEISREYEQFKSERRFQYEETLSGYKRSYTASCEKYNRLFDDEFRQHLERLKEHNRQYYDSMKSNLESQYSESLENLKKLTDILEQWESNKGTAQFTDLRMKSTKKSILAIEEACYMLEAYLSYLDRYEYNLNKTFERTGIISEPFSMKLPDYYPYCGKIIELDKDDFFEDKNSYCCSIKEDKNLKLYIKKDEVEMFLAAKRERIQYMVCYFKQPNEEEFKPATNLSICRAEIKQSVISCEGLYAKVENIYNKIIKLSYQNQYLYMKKEDLLNQSRVLPKGTFITVYLTEYNFALKGKPMVSEKIQDSMSLAHFPNIVMLASTEKYYELYNYLNKNGWLDFDDEWRIGPYDLNEFPVKCLKLQMGNYYGYLAEVKDAPNPADGKYLEFQRMLEEDELFTFTDVFAAADVCIESYPDVFAREKKTLYRDCDSLYAFLTVEFSSQKRMLIKSPMMLYFEKWLELTRRLAEVLQYKKRILVEVDSWEEHKNTLYLYAGGKTELLDFINREKESNKDRFLICISEVLEDNESEEEKYFRCFVNISDDNNEVQFAVNGMKTEQLKNNGLEIDLISLSNVYAEKSQVAAFSEFREGKVTKLALKEIILQPELLQYHDSNNRIMNIYNKGIVNNKQQYKAVNYAFSVEDFFMIQGPPGTGKTTVIKELIMQQLHLMPESKILVVSQANVAVDNVLRGIKELCKQEHCVSESNLIRCGTDDKIAEDIREFSYQGRMKVYSDKLKTTDSKNPELRQKWIEFCEDPENKSIVGECLLRGYQVIGATCVGFANRNVGLNGMDFDLVIIDEAGKALPGELLIPINHAKKLIMIGDHKQLPPVINPELYDNGLVETYDVIEKEEQLDFYNKSFFERLWEECPETNKCMLNTQFRMPSVISGLVNIFYDGQLCDADSCDLKVPIAFDSHLVMLDMKNEEDYKEDQLPNSGPFNIKEQVAALNLVKKIRTVYSETERIVVITPYKNQKKQLVSRLKKANLKNVWVNTIDAFQGDEESIVIYCMTRSCKKTQYFSDSARLNVAFSRSKNLLIIIGSSEYLKKYGKDHVLFQVYDYMESHGRVILYSELMSSDFIITNIKEYDQNKENASMTFSTCITSASDLFSAHEEKNSEAKVEKCRSCGNNLLDYESILCSSCQSNTEIITCKCCKKQLMFPLYLKYVEKVKSPIYCENCRGKISLTCVKCGEQFEESKVRYERRKEKFSEEICSDCLSKKTIECDSWNCENKVVLPRWEINKIRNQKRKIYCNYCRKQAHATCGCCGESITVPMHLITQLKEHNKNLYCKNCQNNISVSCDRCSNTFEIKKWRYNDIQKKGRGFLCESCRRNY